MNGKETPKESFEKFTGWQMSGGYSRQEEG